eukprot:m.35289 g.35289  ORF g.35289 m.35289 type:complete len:164 (-) comp14398_c0_seq1:71-562(-)
MSNSPDHLACTREKMRAEKIASLFAEVVQNLEIMQQGVSECASLIDIELTSKSHRQVVCNLESRCKSAERKAKELNVAIQSMRRRHLRSEAQALKVRRKLSDLRAWRDKVTVTAQVARDEDSQMPDDQEDGTDEEHVAQEASTSNMCVAQIGCATEGEESQIF